MEGIIVTGGGGGGSGTTVATDTIFDAAGDLAVGTGADTAAKLTVGTVGQAPISNGTTLAYVNPPYDPVQPAQYGLIAWNADLHGLTNARQPAQALIYLSKIAVPYNFTATNICIICTTAGTSYSNTQVGLYNSSGTLLSQSAVLASAGTNTFGVTGGLQIPLAAAQSLTGSTTAFVWAALHIGVNSATAINVLGCGASGANYGNYFLAAASSVTGTYTGHATNTLQTIGNLTPASITQAAHPLWMGIS